MLTKIFLFDRVQMLKNNIGIFNTLDRLEDIIKIKFVPAICM
jgi:hypothetical protein